MAGLSARGARRHLLATLLVLVIVCTGLPVTAAGLTDTQDSPRTEAASYVVVLRDAPLALGPVTRPTGQGRLETDSESATTYTDRLLIQQDKVLAQVEAEPTYHYTTVLNGFAVQLSSAEATAPPSPTPSPPSSTGSHPNG